MSFASIWWLALFGGGVLYGLLFLFDVRKHPVCRLCGDNAHTKRARIFDKEFNCAQHGRQFDV